MAVPDDRKYSTTHEWFKVEGHLVTVGITQFAADELTDITYVELPAVGKQLQAGAAFGEIESVKATSDLYAAVSGKVVRINQRLVDDPGLVNRDPFGQGWLIQVECTDLSPLETLLNGPAYEQQTGG